MRATTEQSQQMQRDLFSTTHARRMSQGWRIVASLRSLHAHVDSVLLTEAIVREDGGTWKIPRRTPTVLHLAGVFHMILKRRYMRGHQQGIGPSCPTVAVLGGAPSRNSCCDASAADGGYLLIYATGTSLWGKAAPKHSKPGCLGAPPHLPRLEDPEHPSLAHSDLTASEPQPTWNP